MKHRFDFEFDQLLIRNAMRRDFLWKGYLLSGILVMCALLMRLLVGYWEPMVTGVLLLLSVLIVSAFRSSLTRSTQRIEALWRNQSPSGRLRYELDEEGFNVRFDHGYSRFEWSTLRRLWRYEEVWLLEIVKMQSVFFPPSAASAEARAYIEERCRAHDVRV